MKKYLDWASHEYTMRQRMIALVPLAFLFLLILPLMLIRGSGRLDRKLRLPRLRAGPANRIAGASLGVAGVSFAWWSIGSQMTAGPEAREPELPVEPARAADEHEGQDQQEQEGERDESNHPLPHGVLVARPVQVLLHGSRPFTGSRSRRADSLTSLAEDRPGP